MGVILLIVFFFVSFCIIGLVLLQEGKGGGLTGMSAGMDGVMGAKNPLRRLTAYLFVIFILMAVGINVYFHNREDDSIPVGVQLPEPTRTVQENSPLPDIEVVPEGALRPETSMESDSLRPDGAPAAPIMSIRPEPEPETTPAEAVQQLETQVEKAEEAVAELREEVSDAAASLRPETSAEAVPLAPPANAAATESVTPPTN